MLDEKYFGIFHSLGDELSRQIFLQRIVYSFAGGFSKNNELVDWVSLMRKSVPDVFNSWDAFLQQIKAGYTKNCSCYIFGASNCGKTVLNQLEKEGVLNKLKLCGFLDNFKTGSFQNLPVSQPLKADKDAVIIIANSVKSHSTAITKQLTEAGFKNIYHFLDHSLLSGREYFDFLKPSANELFIDAGCFDGDTSKEFINWCRASYKKIIAFEAVKANFDACQAALSKYKNVNVINKGLYDFNGEAEIFIGDGQPSCNAVGNNENTANSWVNYSGTQKIAVCRLDDELQGEAPTFIKMDIEGSELAALHGAEQTIKKYKPKLAISVYHKPSDILDIPLLLLQLNPDYKLYLRHYSPFNAETDLYAINK